MDQLLAKMRIVESSIDFPQETLDLGVWDFEGESYILKHSVKQAILNFIAGYEHMDLEALAKEIRITGSIGTNQYTPTVDIDVHIVPKDDAGITDGQVKPMLDWFDDNRDRLGGYVDEHPIEVYIQLDPEQDTRLSAVYDVLSDEWLSGPLLVDASYDPYDDFEHISDDIKDALAEVDVQLGELKRDVIDHQTINSAMQNMSPENRKVLGTRLELKLQEIEDSIRKLYATRATWVQARRDASKPATPAEAVSDLKRVKKWNDTNAFFKFLDRYQYLLLLKELAMFIADDESISDDEVEQIRAMMTPGR